MNVLTRFFLRLFKHKQDDAVPSVILCVGINDLDMTADKLAPQEFINLIQSINTFIESAIDKYGGFTTNYYPGEVYAAIPIENICMDSSLATFLLRDLSEGVKNLLPDTQVSLGIGVDSGTCLLSRNKQGLILGNATAIAQNISRYALKSNVRVLFSLGVIKKIPLLKNEIVLYGIMPDSDIKVYSKV